MNKIPVPTEFQICGQKITIKLKDDLIENEECIGIWRSRKNEILLQSPFSVNRPESHCEESFFHEIVHVVLEYMEEPDLKRDEKFVSRFSKLLHQILKTAKYKENQNE